MYDIPYMWNLERNDTNEVTYKTKILTDLDNELLVAGGEGRMGEWIVWNGHVHTAVFKLNN